jgi:GT2 family glycosyltransferase
MRKRVAPPRATCVIVAFHRPESLSALVERLTHPDIELIVVNVEDDAANRRTRGAVVVPVADNVGYAAAVNLGVTHAHSAVVVFCNDDLVADAQAVLALAGMVDDGSATVVVPRVLTPEGATEPTIAPLPTPLRLALEWLCLPDRRPARLRTGRIVQKWRRPDTMERIDAAAAVMVAAPRALLESEPLPEAYFLYWEESEWFLRLHRRGTRVAYVPSITVTHGAGRSDVRPDKSRLLARNAVRCVGRTQGRLAAALAWPVVILWQLRLVLTSRLRPGGRPLRRARHAGLRAALAAWREI